MEENKICAIGQADRCWTSGCEWRKQFRINCWKRPKEAQVEKEIKSITKNQAETLYTISPENNLKVKDQDEWIKKIKVKL